MCKAVSIVFCLFFMSVHSDAQDLESAPFSGPVTVYTDNSTVVYGGGPYYENGSREAPYACRVCCCATGTVCYLALSVVGFILATQVVLGFSGIIYKLHEGAAHYDY